MAEETFRKKIVIDSDELRVVEKEMKKIAADLKQAAKGESQLRVEKLEGQQKALRRKSGDAGRRSRKGFTGTPGIAKLGGIAAAAAAAHQVADVMLEVAKGRSFKVVLIETIQGFLEGLVMAIPGISQMVSFIAHQNSNERLALVAQVQERIRLADVKAQISGSPRKLLEGRRMLIKQYEEEQARLLRNAQSRRF